MMIDGRWQKDRLTCDVWLGCLVNVELGLRGKPEKKWRGERRHRARRNSAVDVFQLEALLIRSSSVHPAPPAAPTPPLPLSLVGVNPKQTDRDRCGLLGSKTLGVFEQDI